MMQQQITAGWQMRQVGCEEWIPAVVPGSVYTDLLRNEKIDDPFWKDNEDKTLALMENDYEYVTTISGQDVKDVKKKWLRFEGLDTIADVYVNDQLVGKAENMHRIWEYDVTDVLVDGDNTLRVYFHSPLKYIREAYAEAPTQGSEDAMEGFVHIRKAHCMFGWDWGAHLPDAGIYRPVYLIGLDDSRMDSVYVQQKHEDGKVALDLSVTRNPADDLAIEITVPEVGEAEDVYTYDVKVTAPDGSVAAEVSGSPKEVVIEDPQLWWPNGVGEQPLYTVSVTLKKNGEALDVWTRRIGLRTMTMHFEDDQWGQCFAHCVNGKDIFAMGADYIPEDHLLGRVTPATTRKLLQQCKDANYNAVRVWGGGYYPEDWFYDICDELGLMVWEDFMFACGVYDLTPEFEANIRAEFIDNVKRLRHHASLGLWCGNNEMEQFVSYGNWVTKASEVRDYLFMFERVIPEVLREYDPQTFYWPASPSSGGSFDKPDDPNRGDIHYWDVWHGNKPFSEYRKFFFRYASEFGFQSFPCKKTIETITDDPDDMNIFSYVMEKHQRNGSANGKILNYLQQTYKYPTDFDTLLYTSQMLQADAIKYGVEHFRRNRNDNRCMGAIVWQLNDCWPVASWASIDYTGRWKALHYFEKRFFAPVMISCQEEGWMTAAKDMNREHFEFEKSIHLNVTNETLVPRKVTVNWALRNADASVVRAKSCEVEVPALTSVWLDKVVFEEVDLFHQYVSFEAVEDGKVISEGTVIFSLPKYFKYQDPQLSYRIEGDEIVVSAKAYARGVEIMNENQDLILSDNYFDMNAGEKRVKVTGKACRYDEEGADFGKQVEEMLAGGLKLRSVYDIK